MEDFQIDLTGGLDSGFAGFVGFPGGLGIGKTEKSG